MWSAKSCHREASASAFALNHGPRLSDSRLRPWRAKSAIAQPAPAPRSPNAKPAQERLPTPPGRPPWPKPATRARGPGLPPKRPQARPKVLCLAPSAPLCWRPAWCGLPGSRPRDERAPQRSLKFCVDVQGVLPGPTRQRQLQHRPRTPVSRADRASASRCAEPQATGPVRQQPYEVTEGEPAPHQAGEECVATTFDSIQCNASKAGRTDVHHAPSHSRVFQYSAVRP